MAASGKVGFTLIGDWQIYKVHAGYTLTCGECGKILIEADFFTRGGTRQQPICRECRPFDFNEPKSREFLTFGAVAFNSRARRK
jgi:hypothetical protein